MRGCILSDFGCGYGWLRLVREERELREREREGSIQ